MAGMSLDRLGGILTEFVGVAGCVLWFPDGDSPLSSQAHGTPFFGDRPDLGSLAHVC